MDGSLYPKGDQAIEALQKIKNYSEIMIEIKNHRNPAFHRKAFALLNLIYDNQEGFTNFDCFRAWITIKAGYFKTGITPNGSTFFDAQSLKFESMSAEKFERWYSSVIDIAIKEYGMNKKLLNEIIGFV